MSHQSPLTAVGSASLVLLLAFGASLPTAAQVEKLEQLRYPALPAFELPSPQRVVLPNGLVVLLIEDHNLPLVQAVALVRAGSRDEPAEKLGLASLAAEVLRSGGAGARGADELDDFLEDHAASIEAFEGNAFTSVNLSCLKGDLGTMLSAFADVLRRPRFSADRLEIAKNGANATVARQNDEPQGIIFRELFEIIYGDDSPYARRPTFASIAGITPEDLGAWHRRRFLPNNTVLGLVGDFERSTVLAEVKAAFGDWAKGSAAAAPSDRSLVAPKPKIYFAEKANVTQSNIAFGTLGIRKDSPDFFAVELMNQILGGGFASRLFSNVRTKKGLSYGVFGQVGSDYDHPGATLFWLSTKTQTTGAAIDAVLEEIRGMAERPPSAEEVALAKSVILNSFIFNADTAGEVLAAQLRYELFGYPLDRLARYRAGIEAVTAEQVVAAAKRYMRPEALSLLVVGPSQGLDKPLSSYGQVETRDISIPPPPKGPPAP